MTQTSTNIKFPISMKSCCAIMCFFYIKQRYPWLFRMLYNSREVTESVVSIDKTRRFSFKCSVGIDININTDYLQTLVISTLKPKQNGRHLSDDIFKCIFLNEDVWIFVKIHCNLCPRIQLIFQNSDNCLTSFRRQAIIWNNGGQFSYAYIRHSASMS